MSRLCFSIKEAAHILRVSDKTIRRWIEHKVVPAKSVGGVWRIPRGVLCERLGCNPAERCFVNGGRECQLSKDVP